MGVFLVSRAATALAVMCLAACSGQVDDGASPESADEAVTSKKSRPLVNIDLGVVAVGEPVSFTVPSGALGFTVILEAEAPAVPVRIRALLSPSGVLVLQESTPMGGSSATAFGASGTAAAPVPQTDDPASAPSAGVWQTVFDAFDPATGALLNNKKLRAKVVVSVTDDGAFHGGALDLHVYIPEGMQIADPTAVHTVNATTATKDPCIKKRFDGFFAAVKKMVGLDRGTISFHPLPRRFLAVESQGALDELFRETKAVKDGQALHFMLNNKLEVSAGNPSWGIAAAIGGAATRNGTALSGVALAVGAFPADGDALTLLHEAGHFIGLSHTSELAPGIFDPIRDTPACVGINAQNFMSCPERRDLMFPLYFAGSDGGVGVFLSPGQVRVFRGSPVVRAYRR